MSLALSPCGTGRRDGTARFCGGKTGHECDRSNNPPRLSHLRQGDRSSGDSRIEYGTAETGRRPPGWPRAIARWKPRRRGGGSDPLRLYYGRRAAGGVPEGARLHLHPRGGGAGTGRVDEGDGAGEKDGLPAAAKKTGSVSHKAGFPASKGNEGNEKNPVGAARGHLPYAEEAQAAHMKQKLGPAHTVSDKTGKGQGSEPAAVLSRKQTAGADGPAADTPRNTGGSRTGMQAQAEGIRRHPARTAAAPKGSNPRRLNRSRERRPFARPFGFPAGP
jgi:hypothetical protein